MCEIAKPCSLWIIWLHPLSFMSEPCIVIRRRPITYCSPARSVFDESTQEARTVVEYFLSFHMVSSGTTKALSLQKSSLVCFFCFPFVFGVPPTRFLHNDPRCLVKSTAVAELPEGAIQAFGTILQHFQGPVLMLPAASILSIASPSVPKNMSPSADSFSTVSHLSSNVPHTSARRSSAATVP